MVQMFSKRRSFVRARTRPSRCNCCPDPTGAGAACGLVNLANTLPAMIGTLLVWQLATPGDFTAVLVAFAALTAGRAGYPRRPRKPGSELSTRPTVGQSTCIGVKTEAAQRNPLRAQPRVAIGHQAEQGRNPHHVGTRGAGNI